MTGTSIKIMVSTLLLASLACGISDIFGMAPPQQQPGELETAVAQRLAETALIQTSIAQGVAGTLNPGQPVIPQNPTQVQPELPSLTPSLEISPTSDKPMVSVSQETNCRAGPGSVYDWLGALNVGQQAEVFGRDPSNTSWYIRNPNNQNGFCWIYGSYATVTGNSSSVPVFTPMPTPTPAKTATSTRPPMDFIVSFKEMDPCVDNVGTLYYARFDVYNNGSVTWQSFHTIVTDTEFGESINTARDFFDQYINCVLGVSQDDLTPGEAGEVFSTVFMIDDNPWGRLFISSIKLCTLDNLLGSCITKTLSFTP